MANSFQIPSTYDDQLTADLRDIQVHRSQDVGRDPGRLGVVKKREQHAGTAMDGTMAMPDG